MSIVHAAFSIALTIVVSCGCSQGEGMPVDDGRVLYEGCFPVDANRRDELGRPDAVVAVLETQGVVIGTVESRDRNLVLVFRAPAGKDKFLYRVYDYSCVTKITFESENSLLRVYYWWSPAGLRDSFYVREFDVRTFKMHTRLISRGEWTL